MTWRERFQGALFLMLASITVGSIGCASTPALTEPTLEDKLARLLKLEDERSLGGGEVQARLADTAGRLRGRAAVVLGRIGTVEFASDIAPLLNDSAPYVRASAAFALGLLEDELPAGVIQQLHDAMGDESETVRARVATTLGRKGGPDTAEFLAKSLTDSVPRGAEPYEWADDMERSALTYPQNDLRAGIFALTRLDSLRFAWDILATQGSTPRFEWWPAAWAVSELDGDERSPLLLYYAGSRNPEFRYWGARGLRTLSEPAIRDHVRVMLTDPNERVRIAAVRAAGALGASEAVSDLVRLLERDTLYVRVEVLRALAQLPAPAANDTLIDFLGHDSAWLRAHALPAVAHQDPDGFWLLLAGIGADPEWHVRAAHADFFGSLSGERPRARLMSMVDPAIEPDARVRARAMAALARTNPEGLAPILVEHLTAEDPYERLAAANALAAVGAIDGGAPIKQAFLTEGSDAPRVKAELLGALASVDPAAGTATARASLDDTNYLVRRKAAGILKRSGPLESTALPRPSELGLEAYRPYVDPPYSPQAYVRTSRGSEIVIELFILDAPMTVRNFVRLARQRFYDGLTVHRVVPNGLIAAGDPRGDGNGGPGWAIRSEINERPMVRGSVAMVDHGKDTAGSQFFITHLPQPDLEGRHTVFGQVTSGMDVVDRTEPGDTIESIRIWDGFTTPYREP